MSDNGNKSKIFVVVISVMVIVLIVIGSIITWKIIQRGQENSEHLYEIEQVQRTEPIDFQDFHHEII